MTAVPLAEAQAKLSELVHALAPGDQVIITEGNLPVARLTPAAKSSPPRRLGTMRGSVTYMAADFDAPLEDFREYCE